MMGAQELPELLLGDHLHRLHRHEPLPLGRRSPESIREPLSSRQQALVSLNLIADAKTVEQRPDDATQNRGGHNDHRNKGCVRPRLPRHSTKQTHNRCEQPHK